MPKALFRNITPLSFFLWPHPLWPYENSLHRFVHTVRYSEKIIRLSDSVGLGLGNNNSCRENQPRQTIKRFYSIHNCSG